MPRSKFVAKPRESDESILASSQTSAEQDSQDRGLERALIEHYAAKKQRKKAAKEQKFLQAAEERIQADVGETAEMVQECINDLESVYITFVHDYASIEDKVRKLWTDIHEVDKLFLTSLEELQQGKTMSGQQMEQSFVAALSKVRTACEDFGTMIDHISALTPPVPERVNGYGTLEE